MWNFDDQSNVMIIAEVAQSYEGSIENLLQMAIQLCEANVDGVMFQVVYAEELAVPNNKNYSLFKKLELSTADWKAAIECIHQHKKLAIGEVFGFKSVEIMQELLIDAFKIHVADLANLPLLRYVGSLNKPILLGVGGAYKQEIEIAIKALTSGLTSPPIVLMHGYQSCPTLVEDSHLLKMTALAEEFKLPVGYSDHVEGCIDSEVTKKSPYSLLLPLVALGSDIKVIEKHAVLDRSRAWEDYESALAAAEFSEFVSTVRYLETALGKKNLESNLAESAYRDTSRKHIVAAKDLIRGTVIEESHLAYKRIDNPQEGIVNSTEVIGSRLKSGLKVNDAIVRGNLE